MSSKAQTLHVLFFPFLATGHMIPMANIAKLFAAHGAKSTILTTSSNAPKLQPTIDRANRSSDHPHPIDLHVIPFPSAAVGMPDGYDNLSAVLASGEFLPNFMAGVVLLRHPFDRALRDLRPDCVVTDMFYPWTYDVAAEHGIPRLVFHGQSVFALCCMESIEHNKGVVPESESVPFVIPGLPDRIEIRRSQIPDLYLPPFAQTVYDQRQVAEPRSFGVVFNSFYDLEHDYADHYSNVLGRKAWHIGPVTLEADDESASAGRHASLQWLDGRRPGSVIYVCFGTISYFTAAQIREVALGLEASGHPFVWAIREGGGAEAIPEGFDRRVEGRGLIIRDWAPQILILNHRAVGGFLTHCGWNSCLEGIGAGLPLITWPTFAEQFYNERLIVDVLRIGVEAGANKFAMVAQERTMVGAGRVKAMVEQLMGDGEEVEEMRRRARDLGEKARKAMARGGSSYADVDKLIQVLMERKIATDLKQQQQQPNN